MTALLVSLYTVEYAIILLSAMKCKNTDLEIKMTPKTDGTLEE